MFCDQILNIGHYIRAHGYPAYARRNGELLLRFLDGRSDKMLLVLSSGVLSTEMPEPFLTTILSRVRAIGPAFLIAPCAVDHEAADLVALRQIRRGHGLTYESQRLKYLQRISEYRAYGFREIVCQSASREAVETLLRQIVDR